MPANSFKIDGEPVHSMEEFERQEGQTGWSHLLYMPDIFGGNGRTPVVIEGKKFASVSFKDTEIRRVRFLRCRFEGCLFIGASFVDCEFTDCEFVDTNTAKLRVERCLLDPMCFKQNFDLVNDTNIAIDLYHAVYRNATEEHQPEHALESLYRMKHAENAHLDSQRKRKVISAGTYATRKASHLVYDFVSGYGLTTSAKDYSTQINKYVTMML